LIVAKVNLVGVQRINFMTVKEGSGFRTFVRLRFSADESNKIMLAEVQRNAALYAQLRASKSFRELDKQTDKIETQKISELNAMKVD
jgi:predicted site-specific integrase-resolvase